MGDRDRTIARRAVDGTALHARRQGRTATAAHRVHQQTDHGHQDQEAKEAAAAEEEGHHKGEAEAAAIAALITAAPVATPAIAAGHRSGAEAATTNATTAGGLTRLGNRQEEREHQGRNHQATEQPAHERGGT